MPVWVSDIPIYRQLRDRTVAMILEGLLAPGAPVPSSRQVAGEMMVNPLTVNKAYHELLTEGVIEKRRGVGLFVVDHAPEVLLASERHHFFTSEWPGVLARMKQLGVSLADLPSAS